MTENKLLKAQATKNGLQAGSIVSGITYVWAVLEVLSGWPWWAKGLLILIGIVGLSAVFYVIWRLNTSQVKDLADKIKIVGQAIAEFLSLFLPFVQSQEDTEPDDPVTPAWPGVVIANGKAYISLDEYDAEKNTIIGNGPDGCLHIVLTKGGNVLNPDESSARFNPADGKCYGFKDWWRDELAPIEDEKIRFEAKIRDAWHKVVELNGAILYKGNRYGYEVYDIALLTEIERYLADSEKISFEAFVEKYSKGA